MVVITVLALLDDVVRGVRYRRPAFAAGLLIGWCVDRLADVASAAFAGLAFGSVSDQLSGPFPKSFGGCLRMP